MIRVEYILIKAFTRSTSMNRYLSKIQKDDTLPYPNSVTNFLFYNTYIVVDNLVDPEELYQIVLKMNDGLLQFNGNENDNNEGNANAEVMAMNVVMLGGRGLDGQGPTKLSSSTTTTMPTTSTTGKR